MPRPPTLKGLEDLPALVAVEEGVVARGGAEESPAVADGLARR